MQAVPTDTKPPHPRMWSIAPGVLTFALMKFKRQGFEKVTGISHPDWMKFVAWVM